jgi:hypothetical protein
VKRAPSVLKHMPRHGFRGQGTNLKEVPQSRKRGWYPAVFETLESCYGNGRTCFIFGREMSGCFSEEAHERNLCGSTWVSLQGKTSKGIRSREHRSFRTFNDVRGGYGLCGGSNPRSYGSSSTKEACFWRGVREKGHGGKRVAMSHGWLSRREKL